MRAAPRSLLTALVALFVTSCSPAAPVTAPGSPSPLSTAAGSPAETEPASPTPEPAPAYEGHAAAGLAFVDFPEEGSPASQIFVVEDDGSLRQLTGFGPASPAGASAPVWSPDGSLLSFGPPKVGGYPTYWAISVIGVDGSDERQLAPLDEEWNFPWAFSPDGTQLAYGVIDPADGPAMWLVDVATGEQRHLGVGQLPRWVPGTRQISFVRAVEGRVAGNPQALTSVVFLLDVDTGQEREFTQADDAVWAPDGSAVLLVQGDEIYLADADASNPELLAGGASPVWSPDATRIALQYDVTTEQALPLQAVIDLDGEEVWSDVLGSRATWSPDGSRLALEIQDPDGGAEVVVVDAATGEELWRTAGSIPAWRPE